MEEQNVNLETEISNNPWDSHVQADTMERRIGAVRKACTRLIQFAAPFLPHLVNPLQNPIMQPQYPIICQYTCATW